MSLINYVDIITAENERLQKEVDRLQKSDDQNRLQIGQLASQLSQNKNNNLNTSNNYEKDNFNWNDLDAAVKNKLIAKAAENRITTLYKFGSTFEGGDGLTALKFRNEIVSYVEKLNSKLQRFVDIGQALDNIRLSFVGEAAQKVKRAEPKAATTLKEFLSWFDKTFDLSALRSSLFDELKDWVMPEGTPNLMIVEKYTDKIELFNATDAVSTADVISKTKLTDAIKVSAVLNAIESSNEKLWEPIRLKILQQKRTPVDLNELKDTIKDAHEGIASLEATTKAKHQDPTVISSTVNALALNQYPELQKANKQYQFRTNRIFKNPEVNINDLEKQYDNNRAINNNRNNRFRNNSGTNSKFRIPMKNNNNNKRQFNVTPIYLSGYCNMPNCKQWGHFASDCKRIHSGKLRELARLYASWRPQHLPEIKAQRNINITQQNENTFPMPSNNVQELTQDTNSPQDTNNDNESEDGEENENTPFNNDTFFN